MTHIVSEYVVTQFPTPIFNIPDIARCFGGDDGKTLPLDDQGLMRTVETVLFPESKVQLLEQIAQSSIWKIKTDEYPYEGDHYIDARFVRKVPSASNRRIVVPAMPQIITELEKLEGTRYIWGGNWPLGIPLLSELYQMPFHSMDPLGRDTWTLKGVDCSGLFYYISQGYTPRNTSQLVNFGEAVNVEGLSILDIQNTVQDLDLIVWQGHAVCVLSRDETIESKRGKGVIKTDFVDRLSQIMNKRRPVNHWNTTDGNRFVIRRWHPDNLSLTS